MNDKQKKFVKIAKGAAFLYIASFFIVNWNDVSWAFNYKEVTGLVNAFFNPYPTIENVADTYFYPNHSQAPKELAKIPKIVYTDKQSTLEIPKIGISVPMVFPASQDNNLIYKDLDSGVVYYPGSVYPGEMGQIVILGHSAPAGWPKIKHDWVFTDINKLEEGDEILIDLNNKQYTYIVKSKKIIKKGEDTASGLQISDTNVLTLISCWPPGKDYQRITVSAELLTI